MKHLSLPQFWVATLFFHVQERGKVICRARCIWLYFSNYQSWRQICETCKKWWIWKACQYHGCFFVTCGFHQLWNYHQLRCEIEHLRIGIDLCHFHVEEPTKSKNCKKWEAKQASKILNAALEGHVYDPVQEERSLQKEQLIILPPSWAWKNYKEPKKRQNVKQNMIFTL